MTSPWSISSQPNRDRGEPRPETGNYVPMSAGSSGGRVQRGSSQTYARPTGPEWKWTWSLWMLVATRRDSLRMM
jgi:hypothetical protein